MKNNNVICVVTNALNFSTTKAKFTIKMEAMKTELSEVLFEHLGTNAPIAFIENDTEELENCGDWTLLPGYKSEKLYIKSCY